MTTDNNTRHEDEPMEVYECLTCSNGVDDSSLLCDECYTRGQNVAKTLPPATDGGHRFTARQ